MLGKLAMSRDAFVCLLACLFVCLFFKKGDGNLVICDVDVKDYWSGGRERHTQIALASASVLLY